MKGQFMQIRRTFSDTYQCPHIVAFLVFMAATVTAKRGGRNSDWISECADFMVEVIGRRLSIADPLPADYDWSVAGARDTAAAMLEYDA